MEGVRTGLFHGSSAVDSLRNPWAGAGGLFFCSWYEARACSTFWVLGHFPEIKCSARF